MSTNFKPENSLKILDKKAIHLGLDEGGGAYISSGNNKKHNKVIMLHL